MIGHSRRRFIIGGLAVSALAAGCGNGTRSARGDVIDARVRNAMDFMYSEIRGARELADKSVGMLVMPLVTEAGFGIGGAYGEGSLIIDGVTVDYYSTTQASIGFQIGAQQFAHTLFFMTPEALADFRGADGWAVGADVKYAVPDKGGNISAESTTSLAPIVALVYGQSGLLAGASLKGLKYTRIIR